LTVALYLSVFVIATCGLVYELVAGTLSSYLLGDTVLQFSTVIGVYLAAMGLGSYASKFVGKGLVARFIQVEAAVGLVGGFSAAVLFTAYTHVQGFRILLYALVVAIGSLVGLEIPLLIRILKDRVELKDLIAQVLGIDYLGALAASLLFPLLLMPKLGLLNTAFVFGLANVGVALWTLRVFRDQLPANNRLRGFCLACGAALLVGVAFSAEISAMAEGDLYPDEVILAKTTPYQRIVITRWRDDLRLFLNSHLQFSTKDEYRYHEALVHPGLSSLRGPSDVLVLGGGDGMAVREILRNPLVRSVTLVDLDGEMTKLFSTHPVLAQLNGGALSSRKVSIVNGDAALWLEKTDKVFDFVAVDFPDPSNYAVGKLFTTRFYSVLRRRLKPGGLVAIQATSPLFARRSFWCIVDTLAASGFRAVPYHSYVPSFGEWGFVLGTTAPYAIPSRFPPGLRYLTASSAKGLFDFPQDMSRVEAPVNRLNNQVLVQLYEQEWDKLNF
jgi:spermidine synthase